MKITIPEEIQPGKTLESATALAAWRRKHVGSQEEFARISGVGRRTLQYYEAAERPLPGWIRPLLTGVLVLRNGNAGQPTKD
jgi:DNA-binding transcriptional regulator YiaG